MQTRNAQNEKEKLLTSIKCSKSLVTREIQIKKAYHLQSIKLSKIILKIIVETTGKSVRKWSLLYTVDRIVT